MHKLTWHGHANFQIETPSANILIDPFFTHNPSTSVAWHSITRPDIVLVTHDHSDHVGDAVAICNDTGASLGAVVGTAEKLVCEGLNPELVANSIGFNIGGAIAVGGVSITMTQAYHSSESGVAVGYILTLDNGFTIYHAGDTGIFSGMALWGTLFDIDLALLPTGGVFTMDARQAGLACKLLQCGAVLPMHWGTFPVLEQTTALVKEFVATSAPDCVVWDMQPGDTQFLEKIFLPESN